jgi:hypothetical protein
VSHNIVPCPEKILNTKPKDKLYKKVLKINKIFTKHSCCRRNSKENPKRSKKGKTKSSRKRKRGKKTRRRRRKENKKQKTGRKKQKRGR